MQFESKFLKLMAVFVLAIAALGFLSGSPHHEQLVKLALSALAALVLAWVIK
jgi:hypothetical protein